MGFTVCCSGSTLGSGINVRFRRLRSEENNSLATCNILVMEYCDKGSLRQAMRRGMFHKQVGGGNLAVDLCAIAQVSRGVTGCLVRLGCRAYAIFLLQAVQTVG